MERAGLITTRPIAGDDTEVRLVLRHRALDRAPAQVRDLRAILVELAQEPPPREGVLSG